MNIKRIKTISTNIPGVVSVHADIQNAVHHKFFYVTSYTPASRSQHVPLAYSSDSFWPIELCNGHPECGKHAPCLLYLDSQSSTSSFVPPLHSLEAHTHHMILFSPHPIGSQTSWITRCMNQFQYPLKDLFPYRVRRAVCYSQ